MLCEFSSLCCIPNMFGTYNSADSLNNQGDSLKSSGLAEIALFRPPLAGVYKQQIHK